MFPTFNEITTMAEPLFQMVRPILPWAFGIALFWQIWRLVMALIRVRSKGTNTQYSYGSPESNSDAGPKK